jgi:3'(2'), 5'-bisphosphate nucleotidase
MNIDIQKIIAIAQKAGEKILEIYNSGDFGIESKKDESPLTLADKAANDIIVNELLKAYPTVPIISEEGKNIEYADRKNYEYFWLVDPLDGTKEFINKNGDFTVNIALIHNNSPILGVIYVPVHQITYHGTWLLGAYKIEKNEQIKILVNNKKEDLIAVGSRSHSSKEDEEFLSKYSVSGFTSRGSSLKFCMVAEGSADIYHRSGPTMEWDTAAGHAIVLAAGGNVIGLVYNKENLLNSSFTCFGFVK